MVEAQAVDRVYRIGQTRKVEIIRYIVPNSVETVSYCLVYRTKTTTLLIACTIAQYVQVVQQEKLHIINQTMNGCEMTESERNLQRRQVGLLSCHLLCLITYFILTVV